jgi:hypothetical protein
MYRGYTALRLSFAALRLKCEGPTHCRVSVFLDYYFNYTGWRETTMPTIFRREVVSVVGVMGFLGRAGA